MIMAIEQHVEWIRDCLVTLRDEQVATIEASSDAADSWVEHVNAIADQTLYPSCNSWYLGANIPGNQGIYATNRLPSLRALRASRRKWLRGFALA